LICKKLSGFDRDDYFDIMGKDNAEKKDHDLLDLLYEFIQKYPDPTTLSDDEIDDSVWADGPLKNNVRGGQMLLALNSPYVEEVLLNIVEMTRKRGYCLFDPQEWELYLP